MSLEALRPHPYPDQQRPARRLFLSYNSKDFVAAKALADGLAALADTALFFAPVALRSGEFWLPRLAEEIAAATAFVLFVGKEKLGHWQVQEYYAAYDRRTKEPSFPLLVVLLEGEAAPGLPFLNQLHWTITSEPGSRATIGSLAAGLAGAEGKPTELWRHTAPYRGLSAMEDRDNAYFFGRSSETKAALVSLAEYPDKLALLVGNSGVGKSSVAQAGILAALKRQGIASDDAATIWPNRFRESRAWAYLIMQPGPNPLRALVDAFFKLWGLDSTDATSHTKRGDWTDALATGRLTLRDLLNATVEHLAERGLGRPPGVLLYVDQGEELYVQSEVTERRCFSQALAAGLGDDRLFVLMSLRADFFGQFQADKPLFGSHRQINVVPLGAAALNQVVARPAALLGAQFDDPGLANTLARRAEEESAKDAGALPLLSYLLDDMWTAMVTREDATLRLPRAAVELGGVLAERADAYLARNPKSEPALKRILTLKLATVREDGEPIRRKAHRSEFTNEEWSIVGTLADHPHRLLVTAAPENGEATAEVAHEALFRHWHTLTKWIASERDFLIWKAALEGDSGRWHRLPTDARSDALLRGHTLSQAVGWSKQRALDLSDRDRRFIRESEKADQAQKWARTRAFRLTVAGACLAVLVAALSVGATLRWIESDIRATRIFDEQEPERELKRLQDFLVLLDTISPRLTPGELTQINDFLAHDFSNLADRSIMIRQYAFALDAARQSTRLGAHLIWPFSNLAHSLMMLNRPDEAREIYLRFVGQSDGDGDRWETVIREDFKVMRRSGIKHPLMSEIERTMPP